MNISKVVRVASAAVAMGVSLSALAQPPQAGAQTNRHLNDGMSSYVCSNNSNGTSQHCAYVSASDNFDVKRTYTNTSVYANEWFWQSDGFSYSHGYRSVSCQVARGAVAVSKDKATLAATLDIGGAGGGCSQWGYQYSSTTGYSSWEFPAGPLAVSATLENARFLTQGVRNFSTQDTVAGTSWRSNCQENRGEQASGTMSLGSQSFAFTPNNGYSQFHSYACNTNNK